MAIVTELVNKITFIGSLRPLDRLNAGLDSAIVLGSNFAAGIIASVTAITAFTVATLSSVDALGQMSKETGIAVEDIQELQYAASVSGSSADAMMSSLTSLTQQIGDAALRGSDDFNRLGVSVRKSNGEIKNASEVLGDVQDRFQGMSQTEKFSFASSLGIDRSVVQLLSKSGTEIDKLKKKARQLGVVTQQQSEETVKFNNSLTALRFGASAVQRQIAMALAPEIHDLAEGFTSLLIENKSFITDGVKTTVEWVSAAGKAIGNFLSIINSVVEKTIGWKVALGGIGLALAIAFAPTYPVTLAIATLILLVDDLVSAFEGGQSVIADFFQEFFNWDIRKFMHDVVSILKMDVEEIKRTFRQIDEDLKKTSFYKMGKFVANPLQYTGESVSKYFKGPEKPRNIINYHSLGSASSITQDVKIQVVAPDPLSAGVGVKDALQNELRSAKEQSGQGGR